MMEAGIFDGDILTVDRALTTAQHNDIVIAERSGEMTVKQLELTPHFRLIPRNKHYPTIEGQDAEGVVIFGVVTHVIRPLKA